jgi:predicted Zn-dependent peptidase
MTRLGKALVTDRPLLEVNEVLRRIDSVTADDVAALAGDLFATGKLSAAGIGSDEGRFREAVAHVNPGLLKAA